MSHHNPPDDVLTKILADATTIAIVGASSNPEKASHGIMKQLLGAGYRVIPVNPKESEILGQKVYAQLADITDKVDIVDVFRRSEDTPQVADEAIALGAKTLWLQLGVSSEEAAARATAAGLSVIMDRCIGATHRALHIAKR
ncbi:MAG: CoA-binding protein [Kofleriaceae bacterium]|nr:CoA-binding protein [Kofleriaceae bacterium]